MLTSTAEALAVRRVPVLQPNGRKTYSVVGSDGLPIPDVESYPADRERLRDRMTRSTLPNGYCTLPEKQTCDFVPTPCLSCTPFFRTTPTFLPIHIRQRDETLRQLDLARQEGRQRAIETHEKVLDRLNTIIDGLEKETTGPAQTGRAPREPTRPR